jgi:hypothetical protein
LISILGRYPFGYVERRAEEDSFGGNIGKKPLSIAHRAAHPPQNLVNFALPVGFFFAAYCGGAKEGSMGEREAIWRYYSISDTQKRCLWRRRLVVFGVWRMFQLFTSTLGRFLYLPQRRLLLDRWLGAFGRFGCGLDARIP